MGPRGPEKRPSRNSRRQLNRPQPPRPACVLDTLDQAPAAFAQRPEPVVALSRSKSNLAAGVMLNSYSKLIQPSLVARPSPRPDAVEKMELKTWPQRHCRKPPSLRATSVCNLLHGPFLSQIRDALDFRGQSTSCFLQTGATTRRRMSRRSGSGTQTPEPRSENGISCMCHPELSIITLRVRHTAAAGTAPAPRRIGRFEGMFSSARSSSIMRKERRFAVKDVHGGHAPTSCNSMKTDVRWPAAG